MRILSVTASYYPFLEFGGPPVKVKALAEGLVRRGHQVTVLTPDWGLAERISAEALPGTAERSPLGWEYEQNGVHAVYLPAGLRYRSLTWNPAIHRFSRSKLQQFSVAHIFGLYDLLGIAVAAHCRAARIPYVVEPIGMFRPIVRSVWAKRIYHTLWGRKMLNGAAALIATSEREAQELRAGGFPADRVMLRRNGVEVPGVLPARGEFRRKFGISTEAKVVLYLGRLSKKKSPELLLRAFSQLEKKRSEGLKLVYAGPDSERLSRSLQQEASELGLGGDVVFAGPVYRDQKWMAYRDADIFVLPSQNENFGNSAAEAIACGLPAIVTEHCGIAPFVGEAALVVRHDVESVFTALQRILSDAELACRMRTAGARVATQLGWEEPLRDLERLYQTLAARRTTSAK